jgi:peptidoglycan/xylan/chitin deacetylase (PgdA/CDA1 family)
MRATFFILIQTNNPDRNIFGQPEERKKKLRQLIEWGMEVGSHTYSHERMGKISPEATRYALARAFRYLNELGAEEPVSLAAPMGEYPSDLSVFSGKYQRIKYNFKLVAEVDGGWQLLPGETGFDPLHIHRIQTIASEWKKFFKRAE